MLNVCILQGRLAADPELQQTAKTHKNVVSIRMAVQRDTNKYSDEDSVDWINLVFWEHLAENFSQLASKGDMIIVKGRLQSRRYEDTKKIDRIIDEIYVDKFYMCGSRKKAQEEGQTEQPEQAPARSRRTTRPVDVYFSEDNSDGELPF